MSKVLLFSVSLCIALVGIPSLIFYYGDWPEIVVRSLIGAFIGLLLAPEIDKTAFKNPVLFQSIAGLLSGGLLGYLLKPDLFFVATGLVLGIVLGFTARWWIKHLRLP